MGNSCGCAGEVIKDPEEVNPHTALENSQSNTSMKSMLMEAGVEKGHRRIANNGSKTVLNDSLDSKRNSRNTPIQKPLTQTAE